VSRQIKIPVCSFLFLVVALARGDEVLTQFNFHAAKVRYEVKLTQAALAASPAWDPTNGAPPISPDVAYKKAVQYFSDSREFREIPRRIERIGLQVSLGKYWYYHVVFSVPRPGASSGFPEQLQCCVLMNGELVPPQKSARQLSSESLSKAGS
jgi:hypothetical protein